AIVGERDDVVPGLVPPYAAGFRLVLVDVVPDVHHDVEVVAFGEVPVAGEEPGLPVRARREADAQAARGGVVGGGGAGTADRRRLPGRMEPVVVPGVRRQPRAVELDGV